MAYENDPPEFTGQSQEIAAEPTKVSGKPRAVVEPAPKIAVYTPPPADAKSKPKHAKLGPALRLDAAEQNLSVAQRELQSATVALRAAELVEADALSAWLKLTPPPSQSDVHREILRKETERKLARIAEGKPAVEPKAITARSPIDLLASQRPRTAPHLANVPLRSPTPRRIA